MSPTEIRRIQAAPESEPVDLSFHANDSHMALPIRVTPLCQASLPVAQFGNPHVLSGGHSVSRLPVTDFSGGIPLRRTHMDIYQTLRPNQVRTVVKCARLEASGSGGKHFWSLHTWGFGVTDSGRPMVEFAKDADRTNSPARNMGNIHGKVRRALVRNSSSDGDLGESEIAQQLADDYGGELLNNAFRIYRFLGDPSRAQSSSSQHLGGCTGIARVAVGAPQE